MDFLDEKIIEERKKVKKERYSSLETGMYIKDELVDFEARKLFDNNMSIVLPKHFVPLPKEIARVKYPAEGRPDIILSSMDTTVNFMFNWYSQELKDNQTKEGIEGFQLVIRRMHPANIFYSLEEIDLPTGKKLSWFDFKGYAMDEQMYYRMFLTPLGGKTLHGIFNCIYQDKIHWSPAVDQIVMTIQDLTREKREII